jgi:endoglucanase
LNTSKLNKNLICKVYIVDSLNFKKIQMKKHLNIGTLVVLFFLTFNGLNIANAQELAADKFAFEQNKRLGRGVNILSADKAWRSLSKARMTSNHFKQIKEAGFDNVRIAIHPFGFTRDTVNYKIDSSFFVALDWSLKQSLSNNLMAIVDFHEHESMGRNPIENKAKFLSMWKQIAEHCKDYPQTVLFEILNEPNIKPALWNEFHKEAYKIMRESNPNRTLLIGSIYGNQIKYLKDLELPENDRNIIVTIHYYMPIEFTHQGAPWSRTSKDLKDIKWSETESEKQAIIADFDTAQNWSKKFRRPLYLGEFGAYEKANLPDRVRWTNFVPRQAEKRGWSWAYWQFDSDFIVYDIDKDTWFDPIKNALIPNDKK